VSISIAVRQYPNRVQGREGDCERREGAARTRKRCALKDSVSYVQGLTTVAPQKTAKEDHAVLCRTPPPSPWFAVVLQGPAHPLKGPHGLCTVPNVFWGLY